MSGEGAGDRPPTRREIQASRRSTPSGRDGDRRTPEMSRRLFLRRMGALGGVAAAGAAGFG
ncbi:MAG: hypothetical protein ACRDZR_07980, partial [Acidimicrobiales bacterium]